MRWRHPLSLAPRGTVLARRREQVSSGQVGNGAVAQGPSARARVSLHCCLGLVCAATLFSLCRIAMRSRKANRTTFLPQLLGTQSTSKTRTGYIHNASCSLGSLGPRNAGGRVSGRSNPGREREREEDRGKEH